MARITNFGKAWYQSMALRICHPFSLVSTETRMQTDGGLAALWMILIKKPYFDVGINVDHYKLGDINAQGTGGASVFGLATHGSAPLYTGNAIRLLPTEFPSPVIDDGGDTSTINFFYQTRTLQIASGASSYLPMADIRGVAFCLRNATGDGIVTTPGETHVIAIHEFTGGTFVTASSVGQTLALSGGTAIFSEA